jgi:hypothetical protein
MAAINPRNPAAWETADPSIQNRGDKELSETRKVLLAAWLANSRYLRKFLSEFYFELFPMLNEEHRYLKDGTGLLTSSRKTMTIKVQRELGPVFRQMNFEFRSRIRRMLNRAAKSQVNYLRARGVASPAEDVLTRIVDNAVLGLDRDFPPGSGITYMNRMERINAEHQRTISNILNRSYGDKAQSKIIADTRTSLTFTKPGRTPVIGGSASKKAIGLFTAEQARLTNEVEVGILRAVGIRLAYWRLSPSHPWYGGNEICEVLASNQDPGIARNLSLMPGGGAGIVLEGLYRVSEWPHYPHPYCRCFPEPVIL